MTQDTVCLGDIFTFTNQSTGTELTFVWDFGDGSATLTDTNTSHTYLTAGDFVVTFTTTGHCGVDVQTFTVTVVDIPIVDFTPSTLGLCAGQTVTFVNNSTTDGSYYWDFGPNGSITSSTLFDPGTISFSGTGIQTVSFAIDYSGCLDSDTVYIVIDPLPIPDFVVAPNAGCGPLDVVITNNTVDSPGTTYAWDYGNGTTSTVYIPVNQTYPAPLNDTVYTIQLIVTSPAGCIDSIDQLVNVYSLPVADFTIVDDTLCLGQIMVFTNSSTNASSYLWDFGDAATSAVTSPTHIYLTTGDFQVMLVAYTPNGCTDTIYQDVYIDSIPIAAFTYTIECFGSTTVFTNNSTGSPVTHAWDFGDGSPIDNSINPTHVYAAAGNYNVTLTVTNAANCSSTFIQNVQVNDVPVADFSWTQTCDGQAMIFTDLSLNTPIGWTWDFGDGFTDVVQNTTHIYGDTGAYTVKLIVSGGSGCLDSISIDVYVDSIPQADFSFTSVCTNDLTLFVDNSIYSPDNYLWDFGDATGSALSDPTHTYTSPGTYTVTLTVDYAVSGCSHTISQDVEAFPRTVPDFTANTPCLGELTDFIDQSTNTPILWEWDFGDGSAISTLQDPSHLYLTAGLFNITLITENAFGCSDTLIQQIEIYGLPIADFSSTTVCDGAGTQFTDLSISDVSWEWDFGDAGAGSLLENPIHIFTTAGTYTTQLIAFNAVGCSDTITHPVVVNPNPLAGFYADTACFGYLTSFTDTSTSSIAWLYDFGDGNTSIAVNPTHIYPADGIYSVQQLVTNVFGCQDSTTLDILIHPQPIAGFSNLTVCAQDVVDFTDTTIGAPTYWEWDFGDGIGTSLSQNPTYVYPVGGFYDVELIAGNAVGCLDTTVVTIEVYTNPVALYSADTVCYLDITTFTDLSSDVVPLATWYYDFGDGINNSGLQNPTYIYQAAGTYPASLTVTNIYGCDSTIQINVVVNNVPIADFTTDTVCWGSPTTFTDISIGTVNTWNWDFGNGFSSTNGPVENYTYPLPGSYLASMEVDGGVGCTDIAYQVVIVVDVLTPAIGIQATACLEEIVQFQDLSVAAPGVLITGWNWDFGDGSTSILQDPLHGYLIPGTYTVTLDVQTSTGCTNSGTTTITVFDPPSSAFDFTIPCEGQPTIFTDNSTDPLGAISYWEWDFGDASLLSFDPSPSHTYAVAGNYDVTLVVASTNGCNDTIIQTVTIYPSPTADFVNGLECGGVPVDLTSTSVGTIVSYEWIYAGSTFSTAQDTLYAFPTTTDTHPVTLVVTTDLGCIDSVTHDVITRPVVSFDFGPFETAGCPVMEVSFFENSLVSSGGAIVNWLWDLGDGSFSFSPNPTHFYEDEGSYTVSLQVITDQDCIYTDTLIYSIIVYPQPTANFTYAPHDISILNPEVDFTNTSSGAQDVEWHFGDFDYSNEWHPTHTYNDTGYFEVAQTVYNEYGCPDTMYQTLYVHGEFVVYAPNSFTPNGDGMNDYFNVKAYGLESYELLIFNRWGELVHTVTEYDVGWDGKYRGQECQSGSYTWKLVGIDFEKIPRDYVGHVILLL